MKIKLIAIIFVLIATILASSTNAPATSMFEKQLKEKQDSEFSKLKNFLETMQYLPQGAIQDES